MVEPYVGEIRMFAGTFAPRGWALCNGDIISVSANQELFSLLGTIYGGDGRTNFALPDMRGRVPIHMGQGRGLTLRDIGRRLGIEEVTLRETEMPKHKHAMMASQNEATSAKPEGNVLAKASADFYDSTATKPTVSLSDLAVSPSGEKNPLPHYNMQPYIGMHFIIALNGTHPSRN